MDDDDDFEFEADTFDQLPAETLQELETQAITRSQAPQVASVPQDGAFEEDDYTFDDEDIIDLNAEPITIPHTRNTTSSIPHRILSKPANAHIQATSSQAAYGHAQSVPPQKLVELRRGVNGSLTSSQAVHVQARAVQPAAPSQSSRDDPEKETLRARLQALEREKDEILQASKDALQTKSGETALLRRKFENLKSESDKRLHQMQEDHKQMLDRQQAQLDVVIRDKKQLETNNRFLEHDIKHNRPEVARPASKKAEPDTHSRSFDISATTPKKNMVKSFGDGFGDGDVIVYSPSKTRDRHKITTPRKGEKRKRSTEQSPAQLQTLELELDGPLPSPTMTREDTALERNKQQPSLLLHDHSEDEQLDLLQMLLNHKTLTSTDTLIEALSAFSLPSQAGRKISSIVTHGIQSSSGPAPFALRVTRVLLSVWRACLQDKLYAPLDVLVDAVKFVFSLQRLSFAADVTAEIVPLLMEMVDLITVPIGQAGSDGSYTLSADALQLQQMISLGPCLGLLKHVALSCARVRTRRASKPIRTEPASLQTDALQSEESPSFQFWRCIAFDFSLVLLMKSQLPSTIFCMLEMLSTSCLADTFGAIHCDANGSVETESQHKHEVGLVDRLTQLLFEAPRPLTSAKAWSTTEVAKLRLCVLDLFMVMCMTGTSIQNGRTHGGELLATHTKAVGSLFRFLSDSINLLYSNPPGLPESFFHKVGEPTSGDNESIHSLTCDAINKTMRIVHHLLTNYTALIDVRKKLAAVHGGTHKHLIGLARLAFSDQLVLEAGIEDAVCEAAHEILDGYLTFEEGESLVEIFSTPPTKRHNATSDTADSSRMPEHQTLDRRNDRDEEMEL